MTFPQLRALADEGFSVMNQTQVREYVAQWRKDKQP